MCNLCNKVVWQWIKHYVTSETAVASKPVVDAETAITQEKEDKKYAKNTGLTTRKPEEMIEEMFRAIRDSLSKLANSDHVEDAKGEEDDEENAELGNLSKDDEPG